MAAKSKYPEELRERTVRLVLEARTIGGRQRTVCSRVGAQLGVPADTLRGWVQRAEIDSGSCPGVTTGDAARMVELERENRELKRANAILRSASAFLAAELDRPSS